MIDALFVKEKTINIPTLLTSTWDVVDVYVLETATAQLHDIAISQSTKKLQ
jgi:hypothetical protein